MFTIQGTYVFMTEDTCTHCYDTRYCYAFVCIYWLHTLSTLLFITRHVMCGLFRNRIRPCTSLCLVSENVLVKY